ncbi:MAG: hypothetical protein AAB262_09180 [Elusimicrobiota bacterium]
MSLTPEQLDTRDRFRTIVEDLANRAIVELGHKVVAVAVSKSFGDAMGIEPGGRVGYRLDVGMVITEVVTVS